ncbi:MAG: hypothetical protein IPN36_10870 [Bacteroidetes bacterium]|nr:hypothetical protein [Bacteroidota bacterium]
MKRLIPLLILIAIISISCVPSRMHNELKAKKSACDKENEELKAANLQLNTRQGELSAMVEDLKIRIKALESDTTIKGQELRDLRGNFEKLNNTYQTLLKDGPNATSNTEATRQLIRDLAENAGAIAKEGRRIDQEGKDVILERR